MKTTQCNLSHINCAKSTNTFPSHNQTHTLKFLIRPVYSGFLVILNQTIRQPLLDVTHLCTTTIKNILENYNENKFLVYMSIVKFKKSIIRVNHTSLNCIPFIKIKILLISSSPNTNQSHFNLKKMMQLLIKMIYFIY